MTDKASGGVGCLVVGGGGLLTESCQKVRDGAGRADVEDYERMPALVLKPKENIWEWMQFKGKQDLVRLSSRSRTCRTRSRSRVTPPRRRSQ